MEFKRVSLEEQLKRQVKLLEDSDNNLCGDTWEDEIRLAPKPLKSPAIVYPLDSTEPKSEYIPREILCTDRGNVIRLLNRERENIIYIAGLGFCVWNGKHWETNADHLIQDLIVQTHAAIIQEIETQPDKATRKEMSQWVAQSNNQGRIQAVMNHLKNEKSIQRSIEDLDGDDWLLNFQNGTLNLKTLAFNARFERGDYISKILPYALDYEATCPQWERFIQQIFSDSIKAHWVQKVAGYSLSGDTTAQFFMFCFGTGGNGKGILLQTLMEVLGPYACSLPPESFMVKFNDGGVPNDIAGIRGSRLVVASEVPSGKKWNEALLKQLTGSDPVKARFLRKEFFTFKPKCKIWISGNPRPAVSDSGNAFWRRLRLVEFQNTFDKPDPQLAHKLRQEIPGILLWCLDGLGDILENKQSIFHALIPPDSILEESRMYKEENDTVARFLDESAETGDCFQVSSHRIYTSYIEWAKDALEMQNILNVREFPKKMIQLGFHRKRTEKGWIYNGLAIVDKKSRDSEDLE